MSMKQNDYRCPKCKGHLNAGGFVVFSTMNKKKNKGLILLSPKVGDYSFNKHDAYHIEDGELVEFFCPICTADLKSKKNADYVGLKMVDHNNVEYDVMFSRKAGDKSTYVVADDNIETFGDDATEYEELIDDYGEMY
ncbi:MAG: hypothetical protein JKX95_07225 [Bacteroidia bacterium]|nr:hypothetical protein [Bacteroidia bacterium]